MFTSINGLNKWILILAIILPQLSYNQTAIHSSEVVHHPIVAHNGMVATQHHLATEVGLEILKNGGNAVDAAVGIGFALAVVVPRAGNLGGGGFMLVHQADSSITKAINYREMAPAAAHRDMYLNTQGDVDKTFFNQSYHSIGVPGTVAGLVYALDKYGTLPLSELIQPAITLAEKGFSVTNNLAFILHKYQKRLKKCEASKTIFYPKGDFYQLGDTLIQSDLAWSLKQIQKEGAKAFYEGKIGQRIINDIQANGGIMSMEDLNNYSITEEDPVYGTYKGYTIASMPPPSSGGVHLIQILNLLEHFDLHSLGYNSAASIHLMTEAMRLAYADRSEHLGDPKFWPVPVEGICSKEYAQDLVAYIHKEHAHDSDDIKPGNPHAYESEETTHFSVVDKWGNVVSNTYTLNFSLGTGLIAEGTGILLNNEMGDFSAKPGSPNAFGLLGKEANAVEPMKRPLSSMTPTIVFKDDHPFLITGSPGGSRIITTVLQVILNIIDHKMNIAEATHAHRIHHQWYPDLLYHENYFSPDTKLLLEEKGHTLKQRAAMGSAQSILIKKDRLEGASDPRTPDAKTKGY